MTEQALLLLVASQGKLSGTPKAQQFPHHHPVLQVLGVSKLASSLTPQNAGPGFQNSLLAHLQPVSFISFNGVHKSQNVKSRREFIAIAKSSWSPLGGLWIPTQSVKVITEISSIFSISKSLTYI